MKLNSDIRRPFVVIGALSYSVAPPGHMGHRPTVDRLVSPEHMDQLLSDFITE